MKNILRNLIYISRRFWLTNGLNFIGMVVALTAFYYYWARVDTEMHFNSPIEDNEDVYRLHITGDILDGKQRTFAIMCAPIRDIVASVDGVDDVALKYVSRPTITFVKDGKVTECTYVNGYGKDLHFWNKDIIPHFGQKSDNADYVYVPQSFAENHFGSADVVGKEFSFQMNGHIFFCNIACVYEDFPANCCVENSIYRYEANPDSANTQNFNYLIYMKVSNHEKIAQIEHDIKARLVADNDNQNIDFTERAFEVNLVSATDAYFTGVDFSDRGNKPLLMLIWGLSLVILTLTSANCVNLTTAETPYRVKGTAIRRVLGASRRQLRIEIFMESVIVCFAAFILAMIAATYVGGQGNIDLRPLHNLKTVTITLLAALAMGAISGWYPAFFSTSISPSLAMKGVSAVNRRVRLLSAFRMVFQLTSSFVIIAFVAALLLQQQYVYTSEYGYMKNRVAYGFINSSAGMEIRDSIVQRIEALDGVERVSVSRFQIGTQDVYMSWNRTDTVGHVISLIVMPVDWKYLRTMGIKVIEGRDFLPGDSGVYIINEAAKKEFDWVRMGKPLGMTKESNELKYKVVGICPNIQFASFRITREKPLAFTITDGENNVYKQISSALNIRFRNGCDIASVEKEIRGVYHELVPDDELELSLLSDHLPMLYSEELNLMATSSILGFVYVLITFIGVFGQTLFESENRHKEIGIRKVFGATTRQVMGMFLFRHTRMLTICFLLSLPITWCVVEVGLQNYKNQTPYLWLAYPISFVSLVSVVLLTVVAHSWSVAHRKPVDNVTSE